jgi:hypothetical protein
MKHLDIERSLRLNTQLRENLPPSGFEKVVVLLLDEMGSVVVKESFLCPKDHRVVLTRTFIPNTSPRPMNTEPTSLKAN